MTKNIYHKFAIIFHTKRFETFKLIIYIVITTINQSIIKSTNVFVCNATIYSRTIHLILRYIVFMPYVYINVYYEYNVVLSSIKILCITSYNISNLL